jgi:uncharacterized membrane protein YkoI
MNAKRTCRVGVAIAALAAALTFGAEERVELSQLPTAVQNTLKTATTNGPIRKIERKVVAGRVVYDVEFERNNLPNPRVRIADNGELLRESVGPLITSLDGVPVASTEFDAPVLPATPKLNLSDLPAPVQATAKREANGRVIADIDRETWRGQPVYEIEFKQRGFNARTYIDEHGTVVRSEPGSHNLKTLFMGMQLDDTPAPVQATIRRVAGDREITDIDRKGPATARFYRVELKDERTTQELRIAEDGRILYDSRATAKPQ